MIGYLRPRLPPAHLQSSTAALPQSNNKMSTTLYNVQLWRDHAAKARALSKALNDPKTKRQMSDIAAGFDRIAELASMLQSTSAAGDRARRLRRPVLAA